VKANGGEVEVYCLKPLAAGKESSRGTKGKRKKLRNPKVQGTYDRSYEKGKKKVMEAKKPMGQRRPRNTSKRSMERTFTREGVKKKEKWGGKKVSE